MKHHHAHAPSKPAQPPAPAEAGDTVPCAYCRGKGTDPFNQLSEGSRCEACHGHGTVHVEPPHVRCLFCNGTGSDKGFRCPACQGAGTVKAVPPPTAVCPECAGRGFAAAGMECLKCRGQGLVRAAISQHKAGAKS